MPVNFTNDFNLDLKNNTKNNMCHLNEYQQHLTTTGAELTPIVSNDLPE